LSVEEINEILWHYDPVELKDWGVPQEEYKFEAREIVKRLFGSEKSFDEVHDIVFTVFKETFGEIGGYKFQYKVIAKKVFELERN